MSNSYDQIKTILLKLLPAAQIKLDKTKLPSSACNLITLVCRKSTQIRSELSFRIGFNTIVFSFSCNTDISLRGSITWIIMAIDRGCSTASGFISDRQESICSSIGFSDEKVCANRTNMIKQEKFTTPYSPELHANICFKHLYCLKLYLRCSGIHYLCSFYFVCRSYDLCYCHRKLVILLREHIVPSFTISHYPTCVH